MKFPGKSFVLIFILKAVSATEPTAKDGIVVTKIDKAANESQSNKPAEDLDVVSSTLPSETNQSPISTTEQPQNSKETTTEKTNNALNTTTSTPPIQETTQSPEVTTLSTSTTTKIVSTEPTNVTSTIRPTAGIDFKTNAKDDLWNFRGTWTKFNLTSYKLQNRNVIPDLNFSDQIILMTQDIKSSLLFKQLPPLSNVTFNITHFINCSGDVKITGRAISSKNVASQNDSDIFFRLPEEVSRRKRQTPQWTKHIFKIPPQNQSFQIALEMKGQEGSCLWAIDQIVVEGIQTGTTNATTTPKPPVTEPEGELLKIAAAIWDSFFALLALFLVCLLALAILVCRNRKSESHDVNTEEQVVTQVPRYSPRSSTFQLEKSRENNAYQMDPM